MILELRKKLKKWHEQEGSKVAESEKGCFGGAYNAWFTAGCKEDEDDLVYQMMTVEAYNTHQIWDIIKLREDEIDEIEPKNSCWSSEDHEEQLHKYELFIELPEPKSDNMKYIKELYYAWAEDGLNTYEEW